MAFHFFRSLFFHPENMVLIFSSPGGAAATGQFLPAFAGRPSASCRRSRSEHHRVHHGSQSIALWSLTGNFQEASWRCGSKIGISMDCFGKVLTGNRGVSNKICGFRFQVSLKPIHWKIRWFHLLTVQFTWIYLDLLGGMWFHFAALEDFGNGTKLLNQWCASVTRHSHIVC